MTPELAKAIVEAIACSAAAVLKQRGIRDEAGAVSKEIGRNAAQTVVFALHEHQEELDDRECAFRCVACGDGTNKTTNDMCDACHRREITREKDEERAR